MRPIQFLLVGLLGAGVCFYFARLRTRLIDRSLVLLTAVAGVVLIAVPEWSTELAALFGVGRGVDLIIYVGLFLLAFVCLLLYARIRALQGRLTDLVRAGAIRDARRPERLRIAAPDQRPAHAA